MIWSIKFVLFLFIAGFWCSCVSVRKEDVMRYDVCVYGGTSAGIIAAYTAAKMGKSVLLIEPGKHLGGLTAGGLGYTDIGNKFAITGLSRDFYRRIGRKYGKFEQWIFEPHVTADVFNEYIEKANIPVLYEYRLVRAEKGDNLIKEIELEYASTPFSHPNKTITAKIFIDCSYEGDLMAKAGISYAIGRESNNVYNETYNGVQLMEGHQFPDGVDPYKIPGDPSSGLLWGISDSGPEPAGSGDKKVQAYNFRICLTNDPGNMVPIARPKDYDSTWYELLLRLMKAQPDKRQLNDYCIVSPMPDHKTDINNRGGFSTDMIGMNHSYPDAGYAMRAEIFRQHVAYTKGFLYFLGHDPRVAEEIRNEMLLWGYPEDEYRDNDHWTPQLYIRESRRMIGTYVMTEANCTGLEKVNDGIAMAAYTMDSHNCQRIIVNGMVKNEGNVEIGGFGPYPISYRSIVPKESECGNLFVPVCLSASHIAFGSIRMEPVFMVLGQSASIAACLAIDANQPVQQVDVQKIQDILHQNPLLDGSPPEVLVDNDDSAGVDITGHWERITAGGYGPSFLVTTKSKSTMSVKFRPVIGASGNYMVYAYLPTTAHMSSRFLFTVFDGENLKEAFINSDVHVEGQTSGEWISLGLYALKESGKPYVSISDKNARGTVAADAILFVPVIE